MGLVLRPKALASPWNFLLQVSPAHAWLKPLREDSSQPHILGRDIGSEIRRESGTVPHYVGRARKNVKKKTISLPYEGAGNSGQQVKGDR